MFPLLHSKGCPLTVVRRSAKGLVPVAIVAMVMAASLFAPTNASNIQSTVSCSYVGAPNVTGIAPTLGPLAGGTTVTITGCGFTGVTSVHFGATSATYTFNGDTQITATSPAHAAGVVDVTVTTLLGTSATKAADQFTYTNACQTATITPDKPSPQTVGVTVTFTATSTNCPNPEYRFWVNTPTSGGWVIAQDYSSSATFGGSTAGFTPGTYYFDVWARNAGSTAAYEAFDVITYIFNAAGACTGLSASSNTSGPVQSGYIITFTGSASGCSNPEYRFYWQKPGGGWQLVQDYDGSTWTWNSAPWAPGTYNVDVWVRQAGHTANPEAFAITSVQLDPRQACGVASIGDNKASPQQTGTIVTFTGSATVCQQPEMRWWVQAPGGGWMIAQDYSVGTTFAWNTAGLAPGTYNIDLWTRQNGSPASYEAVSIVSYTLTAAVPCTAADITADKTSPQARGTAVTFTGTAVGCSQPLYRFWVQAPGGGWFIVRDFSTNQNFVWNTTGLAAGTYNINVWVHQNGSSTVVESNKIISFTLT